MEILSVSLRDFRNIENMEFIPSPRVNILWGENAQGKTNILEALRYAALFSSFRGAPPREIVKDGAAAAEIRVCVATQGREYEIRVTLPAAGRREVYINNVRQPRPADAAGILKCVLFRPEDLTLAKGSAAERRDFMDGALTQLYPAYARAASDYARLLRHKTRILRDHADNPSLLGALDDFSAGMCRAGAGLIAYRERFAAEIARVAAMYHGEISSGRESLGITYKTVSTVPSPGLSPGELYDCLWRHFTAHRAAEIASGSCLSGPHKDDLILTVEGRAARGFASQGQVRTAVLALKLAERDFIKRISGECPVLLFDDVLSELDALRREYVLGGTRGGQVFITTCEKIAPPGKNGGGIMFHVKQGALGARSESEGLCTCT